MIPEPKTIGPFQILSAIAAGGMGFVYRAKHEKTGQLVALKTIKVSPAGKQKQHERIRQLIEAIRRETYTLQRMRHPGVVRFVAQGIHDDLPWYAMELIEGISLRNRIQTYWTPILPTALLSDQTTLEKVLSDESTSKETPVTPPKERYTVSANYLQDVITIIRQLCQTLAFLHGEGVVHRDLKPENILLLENGQPILVDFGIMRRFTGGSARESLETDHRAAGSIFYMAPEQIISQETDARADLYSLGCVLYELLCGQPPFYTDLSQKKLTCLIKDPEPLSKSVDGIPDELEALVLQLLERDPRKRPGYADDVGNILESLGAPPNELFTEYAPKAYLYRSYFAGRKPLLHALQNEVRNIELGNCPCILVTGPSGSGKTRLAMEVARQVPRKKIRVFSSECTPIGRVTRTQSFSHTPFLHGFKPFLEAVSVWCRLEGEDFTETLLGKRGRVLENYEPAFLSLPGRERHPAPEPLPAEHALERVQRYIVDIVEAYAKLQPFLLIIDDLQWADDLTLGVLETFLHRPQNPLRVMVLLTCRSEELTPRLESIRAKAQMQSIQLDKLEENDIVQIVSGMTAHKTLPLDIIQFLSEQSAGNPLFIAEYLKAAVAEGLLYRNLGHWQFRADNVETNSTLSNIALPNSIRELVIRRLDCLSDQARTLAEVGAVWGREWELQAIALLCELSEKKLLLAIDELLLQQIIEETKGGTLRFTQGKTQEILYTTIKTNTRQTLHLQIANFIENQPKTQNENGLLAYHFLQANENEKALFYAKLAGQNMLKAGLCRDASEHLGTAISLLETKQKLQSKTEPSFEYAQLLCLYGDALFGTGALEESHHYYQKTLQTLDLIPSSMPSRFSWFRFLFSQTLQQATHRVLPPHWLEVSKKQRPSFEIAAHAASQLASIYLLQNKNLELIGAEILAVNLAERSQALRPLAQASATLGGIFGILRLKGVAERYFTRSLHAAQKSGDLIAQLRHAQLEAFYHINNMDWYSAESCLEPARIRSIEAGAVFEFENILSLFSILSIAKGEIDKAAVYAKTLCDSSKSLGHLLHETWGVIVGSTAHILQGKFQEALSLLAPLEKKLLGNDAINRIACLSISSAAQYYLGNKAEALEKAEEARKLLKQYPVFNASAYQLNLFLPQIYLDAWTFAEKHGEDVHWLAEGALERCRAASQYARIYPTGRPFALRHRANLCQLEKKPLHATRLLEKSIQLAEENDMSLDAAISRFTLAKLVHNPSATRLSALQLAIPCFSKLQCSWYLSEALSLQKQIESNKNVLS